MQLLQDLSKKKFSQLFVLEESSRSKSGKRQWKCKCDCGNECIIEMSKLKSGHTKSCGCLSEKLRKIETGEIFGNLKVLKRLKETKRCRIYICECQCENKTIKEIQGMRLLNGHVKSCGCLTSELSAKSLIRHGYSKAKDIKGEYIIWSNLKARCYNKRNNQYHNYGGRGIKVCDRWLESFENFIEDMGDRPSKNHSIDRRNVNGNYEKDNCRWATKIEQANNTRSNHFLQIFNEIKTLAEWSRDIRCKVKYSCLRARINDLGWNIEKALVTPK